MVFENGATTGSKVGRVALINDQYRQFKIYLAIFEVFSRRLACLLTFYLSNETDTAEMIDEGTQDISPGRNRLSGYVT